MYIWNKCRPTVYCLFILFIYCRQLCISISWGGDGSRVDKNGRRSSRPPPSKVLLKWRHWEIIESVWRGLVACRYTVCQENRFHSNVEHQYCQQLHESDFGTHISDYMRLLLLQASGKFLFLIFHFGRHAICCHLNSIINCIRPRRRR